MKYINLVFLLSFSCSKGLGQFALVDPSVRSNAVLAQFTNSSGSGFYIRDSTDVYFATARHVVLNPNTNIPYGDSLTLISYREDVENDDKIVLKVSIKSALSSGNLKFDPATDILIIKIATLHFINSSGFASVNYMPFCFRSGTSSRINSWSIENILKFESIEAGREIYIIGYPQSLGLQGKFDLDRPLYRRGIIAGKDKKFHRIIGDAAVYFGNSGGMVLELYYDKNGAPSMQLIGLVSEYIPFNDRLFDLQGNLRNVDLKNSGYSVIVPADEIIDMVKSFK
jgi:hypothetical protein